MEHVIEVGVMESNHCGVTLISSVLIFFIVQGGIKMKIDLYYNPVKFFIFVQCLSLNAYMFIHTYSINSEANRGIQ